VTGKRRLAHQIESVRFATGFVSCSCGWEKRIELTESRMLDAEALRNAYADHKRIADPLAEATA
jgi:hypothetical protein